MQNDGRDLKIVVPGGKPCIGTGIAVVVIFLPMLLGFGDLIFDMLREPAAPWLFIVRLVFVVALCVPWFFGLRWFFERGYAEQSVTVANGRISWGRRTPWWSRVSHLAVGEVKDISVSTSWTGLGRVRVCAKGRRRTVLDEILSEDAIGFGRELKRVVALDKHIGTADPLSEKSLKNRRRGDLHLQYRVEVRDEKGNLAPEDENGAGVSGLAKPTPGSRKPLRLEAITNGTYKLARPIQMRYS